MKTILCYGDSNTWGAIPGSLQRYNWNERWTGILQNKFGNSARIIEEGLGGRTTCLEDPSCKDRNGAQYLPLVLESHSPLDLVILMLGTNDLKSYFNRSPLDVVLGIKDLIDICRKSETEIPAILIVPPPLVVETENLDYRVHFSEAIDKSKKLGEHLSAISDKDGCFYLDSKEVPLASKKDGVHLDADGHQSLAMAIYTKCQAILTE